MRIAVATAVACLAIVSLTTVADAQASIKQFTNIPAQGLGSALQMLAKERRISLVYVSEEVAAHNTEGATGDFTADEALNRLLEGTGFTYRYVNEETVTIVPIATAPAQNSPVVKKSVAVKVKEAQRASGFWGRFRVAAADAGDAEIKEDSAPKLEEIVVTAQKREERLKDVPISISVLSGADLDRSTLNGVTASLNFIPGVSATAGVQGGGTQIVIRGAGAGEPLFNGSSPVGYYLDSVPFGLVKSAILPDAGVYDLERVEVLRGPQGTLYGASAENGLVRVLTHDANLNDFDLKARALSSTTDGGGGNYGGDVAINVPIVEGKLAVRGVVDYQNSSGWINNSVDNHVNDAEQRTYRLKIDAQPTERLSIGLSAWRTRDDFGAPSTSTKDRRIFALLPQPISSGYDVYGLRLDYDFSKFTVESATSYLDYSNEGILDLRIYNIPLPYPFGTNIYAHVFSQELIFNSAPGSSWHWTAGAFYRNAADRLLQTFAPIYVVPTDFTSASKSYAGFGQIGRRFFDEKWEWTLGLRSFHDDVSSQENQSLPGATLIHETASFKATTPRAVLTWYPSSDLTAYASYSEGFRSGAPQDPNTLRIAPTLPFLKPDKLHNYELGAKGSLFDRQLSFDLALYYIKWKDVQQSLELPTSTGVGVTALVNSQSASGPGIDLEITTRPIDALELGVTFSWNDLKMDADVLSEGRPLFVKGDRLNYSSEFTGGALANYTFAVGEAGFKCRLGASANYSSKQTDHAFSNGAAIVNAGDAQFIARASLAIIAPSHWTGTVFVDNFTNNYGARPQSLFPVADLTPRPRPRTMGLQFDYSL